MNALSPSEVSNIKYQNIQLNTDYDSVSFDANNAMLDKEGLEKFLKALNVGTDSEVNQLVTFLLNGNTSISQTALLAMLDADYDGDIDDSEVGNIFATAGDDEINTKNIEIKRNNLKEEEALYTFNATLKSEDTKDNVEYNATTLITFLTNIGMTEDEAEIIREAVLTGQKTTITQAELMDLIDKLDGKDDNDTVLDATNKKDLQTFVDNKEKATTSISKSFADFLKADINKDETIKAELIKQLKAEGMQEDYINTLLIKLRSNETAQEQFTTILNDASKLTHFIELSKQRPIPTNDNSGGGTQQGSQNDPAAIADDLEKSVSVD